MRQSLHSRAFGADDAGRPCCTAVIVEARQLTLTSAEGRHEDRGMQDVCQKELTGTT